MPHVDQVRNHARWRPGWRAGRTGYAWLLPLSDQPGLRKLVNDYQYALRDLPGFDLVPLEWMHILVQEIGFTDEIDEARIEPLVAATRKRLESVLPLTLAFHHAVVQPESLSLPAEPQSTIIELRTAVREALADVLGEAAVPPEPEDVDKHVSLAHSTTDGPAIFAVATLSGTQVEPTTAKLPTLSLVKLNRDHSCSEWEKVAEVPLGS
ncbi:2'-5' RNA ligase [Saccharopolyspora antimicrobica]|uniref:2'-5' RNA ligase n=1 Tax=Saccharopolyspora antimicrobica TaxID=455193 RepID=A0A1I4Z1N6_9PSEU|nr:2'-5' RNA ligase family protein [Saccharopolyspora antimicrobica]RKT82888.1 2'-5' RNA ligase [Saccharopolyspora antimicrobica]SFN43973.1 2'-5' RNA ligase [Saccharopolyspora antimicrobica]